MVLSLSIQMLKQNSIFKIFFNLLVIFLCAHAYAQTDGTFPTELINNIETPPALPEPVEGEQVGVLISASNAQKYKALIPLEFYPLVRAQLIELDAAASLRVDLSTFAEALNPVENYSPPKLESDGSLPEDFQPTRKLVFEVPIEEENASIRAKKILWNVKARQWSLPVVEQEFSLLWIEDSALSMSVSGKWTRIYPRVAIPGDKSIQVFRDRISITSPSILEGFSWLTFRFFGKEEDMLWLSSPALQKTRQLTGSNRSDAILSSSVSPDDFLGWSGKLEQNDAILNSESTTLVPFPDSSAMPIKVAGNGCFSLSDESSDKRANWNFESRRFQQAFPWWPTKAVFVPRKVYRLELIPKDPFSLYGRQIIYIDKELFIPYYKFVFDRAGYLWKSILSAYQPAMSVNQSERALFNRYVIVEDRRKRTANILDFSRQAYCDSLPPKIKMEDFDPQKLLPQATATAAATSTSPVKQ